MRCWEFLKYDSVSGDAAKICQQLKVAVGSPFGAPQEHIHTFFLPDIEHIYMSEKKAKRKEKDNIKKCANVGREYCAKSWQQNQRKIKTIQLSHESVDSQRIVKIPTRPPSGLE